jgi:hypothetical protein
MNAPTSYIRLPSALSDGPLVVPPQPLDDDEFSAHQVEFIQHVFGYCAFLRARSRDTPVSDAFLAVFVNLIEVLNTNAPDDARRCAAQLQEILGIVFPGLDSNTSPMVEPCHPSDIDAAKYDIRSSLHLAAAVIAKSAQ